MARTAWGAGLATIAADGSVLDTDKPMWVHGRFVWLLATMMRLLEPRDEWRELARHGLDGSRSRRVGSTCASSGSAGSPWRISPAK